MSIIGANPTSGFRIDLVRAGDEPPFRYAGKLATRENDVALAAIVTAKGDVTLEGELETSLAERVRLLIRQVIKHALAEEQTPPRRIQRWRP